MFPSGALPGRLFVLEGPDGVGKTTICREVADRLQSSGRRVLQLSFPGRTEGSLGELVYRLHHGEAGVSTAEVPALAIQTLHVAAHIDAIRRQIVPALQAGALVVLDRYWWSTAVYGRAAGCTHGALKALIDVELSAWGNLRPDVVLLLQRTAPLDRDIPILEWRLLARYYRSLARAQARTQRVEVVTNNAAIDATVREALEVCTSIAPELKMADSTSRTDPRHEARTSNHLLPVKTTAVYDSYWTFAAERQSVYFRRLHKLAEPWTADPVILAHKFTNAYRASDRVSQYLIREVIYRNDLPETPVDLFFRTVLFKLFNRISTWESLEAALGPLHYDGFSVEAYDAVLTSLMRAGQSIYSAAYIMPTGTGTNRQRRKHLYHLALLSQMIRDEVPQRIVHCTSFQQVFELIRSYPGIGDFLAYQYAVDLNYSPLINFNEMDFVVPGPGALDGIHKCFADLGGLTSVEVIRFVADRQEKEFARLGIEFPTLWGRRLQLIDCQNLFCEVGKYARVRHPEMLGLTGRTRIKQRFKASGPLPRPWFPPKWGLNERIEASMSTPSRRNSIPSYRIEE